MDFLLALARVLGIPLNRLRMWDPPPTLLLSPDMDVGDNLLVSHPVESGNVALLCFWGQYLYAGTSVPQPLNQMPFFDETQAWWRVEVGGTSPQDLDRIFQLRNPWSPLVGISAPCFYLTEITGSATTVDMFWHLENHPYEEDYEVSGRLLGFDFDKQFIEEQSLLGYRADGDILA